MESIQDIFTNLTSRDKEAKVLFYDQLAFNLTIAIRSIWSNPALSDKEKVEKIKIINELSHRIFHWIWRLKKDDETFNDLDCLSDIKNYATQDKHVAGEIGLAVSASYRHMVEC
jgi:hypothetical protein